MEYSTGCPTEKVKKLKEGVMEKDVRKGERGPTARIKKAKRRGNVKK